MRKNTAHAKILALLLSFVMVLSTAVVFAEGEEVGAPVEPAITLDPTEVTIDIGNTVTLAVSPQDAEVTWASEDEEIATVENGEVTAVAAGTTTITASMSVEESEEPLTAECTVTVPEPEPELESEPAPVLEASSEPASEEASAQESEPKVTSTPPAPHIMTTTEKTSVVVGKSFKMKAVVKNTSDTPTWKSSNTAIATVTSKGMTVTVTGKKAGTVTITASVAGKSAARSIKVKPAPHIMTTTQKTSIAAGKSFTMKAVVKNTTETPTWKSSDTSIATVTSKGMTATVTGKKAGTVTITASVAGKSAARSIKVTPAPPPFTTVKPVLTVKKKYSKDAFEGAKDNGYILSWTHSNKVGVDAYLVLRDGKLVRTLGKDVSKYELMAPSGEHKYTVKAVKYKAGTKAIYKSISSDPKIIKVEGVITATHPYTWYCKPKKKATIYSKGSGGSKVCTVAKGTMLYAIGRYPTKIKKFKSPKAVKVRLPNGKTGWIKYKDLSGGVKVKVNVKQDYSRSLKEYMVNNAAFSKKTKEDSAIRGKKIVSKDDTLVWACLYTQRAYTFKKKNGKWVLVHSDRITTGKFSHPTRSSETSGIYTINKKKSGKVWMVQENGKRYYFTHASYITKGISFHTGTWWENGKTRGTVKANGHPGTYGCIRMKTGGAKYIFKNVKKGKTGVIVTRYD